MRLNNASAAFLAWMRSSIEEVFVAEVGVPLLYRIEDIGCRIEYLVLRDKDEVVCLASPDSGQTSD